MHKEVSSIFDPRTAVVVFDKDVDMTEDGFLSFLIRKIFAEDFNNDWYSLADTSIDEVIRKIEKLDKPFVVAYGNAVAPIEEALDKTNNYIRRVFIRPIINEKIVQSLVGNISEYDMENTFTVVSADDIKLYNESDEECFLRRYHKKHPKYLHLSTRYDKEETEVEEMNGLDTVYGYMLQLGYDPYVDFHPHENNN